MQLTKQEVEHLAKLSRLSLSEEEKERFSSQLSSILEYVSQLQKITLKKDVELGCEGWLVNVMRGDEVKKPESYEAKKLVEQAPSREGDFVKTKAVFE
jgi:aspartyl-tRNA(Asn)/glutamyl-tRNA(Gln) amidotransferase subunit C